MNAAKKKAPERRKQAIDAPRGNVFYVDPWAVKIVGRDTSHKKGEHRLWDKRVLRPVDEALAKNIDYQGVLEPVLVVKDGDVLLVGAGRRRTLATRRANEIRDARGAEPRRLPVMVVKASDERLADLMVSENELRSNNTVQERLELLEGYMPGHTEEEAAVAFGVDVKTIQNWLLVVAAGPAVKKAFYAEMLPITAAVKISKLSREQQSKAVEEATKDGKATVAAADRAARTARDPKATPAIVPPGKRQLKELVGDGALFLLEGTHEYVEGFRKALRLVLGEIAVSDVDGLQDAIDALDGAKSQEAAQ